MNRRVLTAGVAFAVAGALTGCGRAELDATPDGTMTPSDVATPAAPSTESQPPTDTSVPADHGLTTTSPTGDPSSSFWTDEKLQQVRPEDMPTER